MNFDQEIYQTLQDTFDQAILMSGTKYSVAELKLLILATNLESIAKMLLFADSSPDAVQMDLKKMALGLLGTIDWAKNGIDF